MPTLPRALAVSFALLLAVTAGLWLSRYLPRDSPPPATVGVDWAGWLPPEPDDGFGTPSGDWRLALPGDHGAHPRARMEVWNIAAHLVDARGEDVGLQFALFRLGVVPPDAPEPETAWELRALYRGHVTLLRGSPEGVAGEERFSRAASGAAGYAPALRSLWLDDWSLQFGQGEGDAQLRLQATVDETEVELLLTPAKPAVAPEPGGGGAPVRGYSMTRMAVQGLIGAGSRKQQVSGLAWLDHAWGELPLPGGPIAWDRLQLQLDDGTDLSVIRARRRAGDGTATVEGFAVGPDGTAERLDGGVVMQPSRMWRHEADGARYPVEWRLEGGGLDLRVAPATDDQLHDFLAPLWSGMVTAEGFMNDRRVTGVGTLNLTEYETR